MSWAAGLSSEVARMAIPIRVWFTMYCSTTSSSTVTPTMMAVMLVIWTPPMVQTTMSKGRVYVL